LVIGHWSLAVGHWLLAIGTFLFPADLADVRRKNYLRLSAQSAGDIFLLID
jgi:hypothetical protein